MMTTFLNTLRNSRFAPVLALILGAIFPFSLAPYHLWPIALLSIGVFADLLQQICQTSPHTRLEFWHWFMGGGCLVVICFYP
jgi:apolipoprotein N-acyltransferase